MTEAQSPPPGSPLTPMPGVTLVNIEQEMKVAYLDYAMSVIIGRALPDVRDGLKPAHRRVLYAMYREGLLSTKRYSKCAGVVGEVLKKYHPHGDSSVYDTLVRLAQDWNMRYPLIDGQGNFGSIDGDSAAAYRYTEARLTKLAEEMLDEIDQETVNFIPNFDESTTEPTLLPTKFPNLLVNGSSGIAVGMATNIAPHNLGEVVDGLLKLIENPQTGIEELMKIIPGPDFPTAGFIYGGEDLRKAYMTGRGIIQLRGRAEIEQQPKKDRQQIIIDQIPYQVNKSKLVEKIAELVRDKKIEGISDLRDESNRQGIRVVVELKKDFDANIILNQLYKHTPLQTSFGINMVAIVGGQPRTLSLKDLLENFVAHRKEIVTRRTIFRLRQAEQEAHILEGLKIALDHLDAIIELIKRAKDPAVAKLELTQKYPLSAVQAQAILDMRLARLTGLEREKIIEDYTKLIDLIKDLRSILADEKKVLAIIQGELVKIRKDYADPRRTHIAHGNIDLNVEDLIQEEDVVVTISHQGYIKRNAVDTYRTQKRGGRGVIGMGTREEDFVEHLFVASTHADLLFFTAQGKVYWLKVHELPEASRTAKGKAIVNLLSLKPGDRVTGVLTIKDYQEGWYIIQCTRKGVVKKTDLMVYAKPRPGGIIALTLDEGDELISAALTNGKNDIFLGTRNGLSIRFNEEEARPIGRASRGVRGIHLDENDVIVGMGVIPTDVEGQKNLSILTVTERGYGKRTEVAEYRQQGRAGHGIINLKVTDRVGCVVSFVQVCPEDQFMVMTDGGNLIRTQVDGIPVQGRNTQGVRTIAVGESEKVIGITKIAEREDDKSSSEEPEKPEKIV